MQMRGCIFFGLITFKNRLKPKRHKKRDKFPTANKKATKTVAPNHLKIEQKMQRRGRRKEKESG